MHKKYISDYWPNVRISKREVLTGDKKNNLKNSFQNSPFISSRFTKKIDEIVSRKSVRKFSYKMELPQGAVNFHFCSDRTSTFIDNLAKYYFFVVFLRLNYNSKYDDHKFLENVYINILPVSFSKKLSKPIGIDDINSASTLVYPDYYGGPIFIWRLDEIEKVLVHEALHSMHYDVDIINMDLVEPLLSLDKSINMLNINEAYTELCASFIYNLFKDDSKTQLMKNMENELKNSLMNCGKLLETYGIKKIQNLYLENYRQNASAFSYIILKTGLLWLMLKKCKKREGKTVNLMCLEEFLSIGFWGVIGQGYQSILVSILENPALIKDINKNIKEDGKGRRPKLIMVL